MAFRDILNLKKTTMPCWSNVATKPKKDEKRQLFSRTATCQTRRTAANEPPRPIGGLQANVSETVRKSITIAYCLDFAGFRRPETRSIGRYASASRRRTRLRFFKSRPDATRTIRFPVGSLLCKPHMQLKAFEGFSVGKPKQQFWRSESEVDPRRGLP